MHIYEAESILIFFPIENLRYLSNSQFWIVDGIFNTVPLLQLYTIHGYVDQTNMRILPLVYILLTSKSQEIYYNSFDFLLDISLQNQIKLNPPYIMSDFKLASINGKNRIPESIPKCG
ncbi:LOW QUALITY PROTEIN: hypothetical protein HZS_760 [Henneguya salminicola]|nr:LOW QUALITY PROTEIN: hypothetical protein HZS_760 [Henneguya salminicola]